MRGVLLGLLVVLLVPAGASAQRLLIDFQPGANPAAVHRAAGVPMLEGLPQLHASVVDVPASRVASASARLRAQPGVRRVERDGQGRLAWVPNDPLWGNQWHANNSNDADIDLPRAWDYGLGSTVRVAVLDTGIDPAHPDLASRLVLQRDFTGSGSVDDFYGHGTHVAGIIAAVTNNGQGVSGIAPGAQLLNGKVVGNTGTTYCSWISSGITWATDNGARIINISVVLDAANTCTALANAVNYANTRGALVVAAAGNAGTTDPLFPAYYSPALAVAATDQYDRMTSWSTRGSWVDLAAPGASIYSTMPTHSNRSGPTWYAAYSGTSMASPVVAGVAALTLPRVTDRNGDGRINDDLRNRIILYGDARSLPYNVLRVNACRAVALLASC